MTLLTDFGTCDAFVGIMKGVLFSDAPNLRAIVDLTHEVRPQDVVSASFHLTHAWRWFPSGTVHVAVVDPGVGSGRAILVAMDCGHAFLAPDNGLLGPVLSEDARVARLDVERFAKPNASRTFHGRDVFAPAAARLAAGLDPLEAGGCTDDWERPPALLPEIAGSGAQGEVVCVDHFGNLITNLGAELVARGGSFEVAIGGRRAPLVGTYAEAAVGELCALVDSYGLIEVSVRGGSAARELGLGTGVEARLETP